MKVPAPRPRVKIEKRRSRSMSELRLASRIARTLERDLAFSEFNVFGSLEGGTFLRCFECLTPNFLPLARFRWRLYGMTREEVRLRHGQLRCAPCLLPFP